MAKDALTEFIDRLADAIAKRVGSTKAAAKGKGGKRRKITISPEGIARIRAAQKKRWAKYKKTHGK
jgi:hypothetical protein